MTNNRSATESMNGFFYQRYYCIYNILHKTDFEYVLEEGSEDIDLIKDNNKRDVIQVKYYGNFLESLTYNSGLYKVIVSNFEKNDIDTIVYYAFNLNEQKFQPKLEHAFINKKYYSIGKYILLLYHKNNNELKDNFNINNIDDIDTLYQKYKTEMNNKHDNIFLFFNDENNCNNYFSKFKLEKGLSYNDLNTSINNKIFELFNSFVNTNNNENKKLRIELIKNTILNILTDTMFKNNNTHIDRMIKTKDIFLAIENKILTYTDPDNLYYELLKQTENVIKKTINNLIEINKTNNTLNYEKKININMFVNQIQNIKINSLDNLSFYTSLLNKHFKYLDINNINFIRIYLIELIIKNISNKHNIVDKLNLFKYIGYISSKKIDKEYKISESKIIKLLDPNHKINVFFK